MKIEMKIRESVEAAYSKNQADIQNLLTVAAIIFAMFTFGFPILQHQFITKEHVDELKKQLDIVTDANEKIEQAIASANTAQKTQDILKTNLEEIIKENKNDTIEQVNDIRKEQIKLKKQTEGIEAMLEEMRKLVQENGGLQKSAVQTAMQPTIITHSAIQPIILPKLGDIIPFGKTTDNHPLQWKVLDVDITNNKALLLSEDIIDKKHYHLDFTSITWEKCWLRNYLNSEFYNGAAFNDAERARIILTRNENPDNTWGRTSGKPFNTPGGKETDDHIFLLSIADILKYYPGLKLYKDSFGDEWRYEADGRLMAKFGSKSCWWWLRSPGYFTIIAAYVSIDGTLKVNGYSVSAAGGVRPALWLNLES